MQEEHIMCGKLEIRFPEHNIKSEPLFRYALIKMWGKYMNAYIIW